MTVIKHELKQGRLALIIWTAALCFFLSVSVFIYPEMKGEMNELNEMFSSMGAFSDAFGMDNLNFGTLAGYYATECGNTLDLGGALFAAICAAAIISKEEQNKTAEFLLTHPIGRSNVIAQKLVSVIIQITVLNLAVFLVSACSVYAIGEKMLWKELGLLHIANWIMQIEIAGICFGISSLLRKGSIGVGIGIVAVMYFMNITANITDSVSFLKYLTPYGYCDGGEITANLTLDWLKIAIGMCLCIAGTVFAFFRYAGKDIKS